MSGSGSSALEKRVSEFTLSNGLHFIVLERHNAPIVSCHTYANVGAFDEQDGQTGWRRHATSTPVTREASRFGSNSMVIMTSHACQYIHRTQRNSENLSGLHSYMGAGGQCIQRDTL